MKDLFVPYEVALRMKALGFNEPCFGFWSKIHGLFITTTSGKLNEEAGECLAPTFSQCFRWFREKYNLHSFIDSKWKNLGWEFELVDLNKMEVVSLIGKKYGYNTYDEAEIACLDKLIEIIELKKLEENGKSI